MEPHEAAQERKAKWIVHPLCFRALAVPMWSSRHLAACLVWVIEGQYGSLESQPFPWPALMDVSHDHELWEKIKAQKP